MAGKVLPVSRTPRNPPGAATEYRTHRRIMVLICAKTLIQASLVHVLTQYSKHVGSLVNQTVFPERACASERGRGGRAILSLDERSPNTVWFTRLHVACGQTCA